MDGISSSRTMRLCGVIRERTVTVLIDNGVSHNFISVTLVPMLKLNPIELTNLGSSWEIGGVKSQKGCAERYVSLYLVARWWRTVMFSRWEVSI